MGTYADYDFNRIRNPELRALLEQIFDIISGHDHDGTNSKAVTAGAVTNAANVNIADAGNRITASQVEAALQEIVGANRTNETIKSAYDLANGKYSKPGGGIPLADLVAAVQASLALADTSLQPGDTTTAPGTPVNAVAAVGTLTLTGVVIDGETFTIGDDVYEFCADVAQSKTAGTDFAVNINAHCTKSSGTLTVDTQPTAGDTMTIGTKVYIFVPHDTANADGEIDIGDDLAGAKVNIVAAINGTDGHNTPNADASAAAFNANNCTITALVGGTAGDAIATTETFAAETNIFAAVVLGGGADCSAANAILAIVISVTANDTEGVGAVDGDGDTVVFTADTKGIAGNAIGTSKVMANASFGHDHLLGGVDGTVGAQYQTMIDASYLYFAIAANTIADTNWRRISLGTVY